ncbi:MAG: T9SS type A sorting domain-containing protein [Bacteroidota bacterium]|nr:T9SS type A sorting domain-containing protein [Bacteroidota bacterium]
MGIVSLWTGAVPDYNYLNDTITEATITNHEWGHCIVKDVDFHTPAATGDHNIQITLTDAYGETTTITRSIHVEYCPDNVVQENKNPAWRLYPNPANNKLHLQIPTLHQTQQAEIYDAQGKLVLTQSISTKTASFDISNVKPGNYILKIDGVSKGFTVVR